MTGKIRIEDTDDHGFEDVTIDSVVENADGWTVNRSDSCSFGLGRKELEAAECDPPRAGEIVRVWGDFGRPIRGVALSDQPEYARRQGRRFQRIMEEELNGKSEEEAIEAEPSRWRVAYYRTKEEYEVFCKEQAECFLQTAPGLQEKADKAIKEAGVMTESELRDSKPPWPKTLDELTAYIDSFTKRPHDYGTCVYAMAYTAVATFNYVASQLGCTGFQASVADMIILQHTRHFEWGRILDYSHLLYPQYRHKFQSFDQLIMDPQIRPTLAKKAKEKLAEEGIEHVAPSVREHWEMLAALVPNEDTEASDRGASSPWAIG